VNAQVSEVLYPTSPTAQEEKSCTARGNSRQKSYERKDNHTDYNLKGLPQASNQGER